MTANPLPPFSGLGAPTGVLGQAPTASNRFKQVDPIRLLRQHSTLWLVTFMVSLVFSTAIWGVWRWFGPTWQSESYLEAQGGPNDIWTSMGTDLANNKQALDALEYWIANQETFIKSERLIEDVLKRTKVRGTNWYKQYVYGEGPNDVNLKEATDDFKNQLTFRHVPDSTLIQLRFRDDNKKDVQHILQNTVDVYLNEVKLRNQNQQLGLNKTFNSVKENMNAQVRRLQDELKTFLEKNDVHSLDTRSSDAQLEYQSLIIDKMRMLAESDKARGAYESAMQALTTTNLAPSPEELITARMDPAVRDREEQLRQLREQRGILTNRLGESHASILRIDETILEIEREKNQEIQRLLRDYRAVRMEQAQSEFESLQTALVGWEQKIQAAGNRMTDLTVKLEQYEHLKSRLVNAEGNRDKADASLEQMSVYSQRPDTARVVPNSYPSKPQLIRPIWEWSIPLLTIGISFGVFILVFFFEMVDQRIKTPADVKLIRNAELLGVLPDLEEDPFGRMDLASVVRTEPTGLMAESFRQVRTSILARMDRRGYKTLMLVSAMPKAGVSICISNLAASLAFNDRKVLVLDANFRRPNQNTIFEIDSDASGLVDVLKGKTDFDDAVIHLDNPTVDVLTAGRCAQAHPELLEGAPFRNLLATLESRYDLILIDAPPALLASDSSLLAKQVDAIVLIVRAVQEKQGMIERMINRLDGQRADLLGVVLNGVRTSAGGYMRQNYREFYDYADNGRTTNNQSVSAKDLSRKNGGILKRSSAAADQRAQALSEIQTIDQED